MAYKTLNLTLEQKTDILRRAKEVCDYWWVDILDCSKSWRRQKIDMSFEEIMLKYDGSHLSIIHRDLPPENHLEIGFRIGEPLGPDYFLWIILDPKYIPEFTAGLEEYP